MDGLAGTAELGVVLAELVLAGDLKEFFERLVLDAPNAFGRDEVFPFGVLLDVAPLDQHVDDVGMLLFPLVEVVHHLVAPVEHVLGQFVEDLVGRLRAELLGTVELGIFKLGHFCSCRVSACLR